jgi:UbiD family decarboxylase
MHSNLRSFMDVLKKEGELRVIDAPVDPCLEIAEIHRRVTAEGGPALLFTNVKGSSFPVATNLIGTRRRVELVMGPRPEMIIKRAVAAMDHLMPPKASRLWKERDWILPLRKVGLRDVRSGRAPVLERRQESVDLSKLPALTSWPGDGGPFVTLPLVYTENPDTGAHNLGMYRNHIYEQDKTGMHWQIHKGGGFHHALAEERNINLPATLFIGGPLALTVAAITALPESVPELLYASFLMGEKLDRVRIKDHPHPLVAQAEFAICGYVPPKERRPEGPFGDHYGYYSLAHDFPVFHVKQVYHRKDAIFPATVVGKPRQEDYWIGEWMQDLLGPMFPVIMPGVRTLWNYAETGYHCLTAAVVRESYFREALSHAFRILGEGQLSLTKILMLTDQAVDLKNFPLLLETILERFRPERDLVIINGTSMDTLDYTGRKYNQGSKAVMLGMGPKIRSLPLSYTAGNLPGVNKIVTFCPGCLAVSGRNYNDDPELAAELSMGHDGRLNDWPMVVLVDDASEVRDPALFLWTVFTRFDPAWDIHAKSHVRNNKIEYSGPVIIDCRMKPWYPGELIPDPEVSRKVDERWREYFA